MAIIYMGARFASTVHLIRLFFIVAAQTESIFGENFLSKLTKFTRSLIEGFRTGIGYINAI